MKTKVLFMSMLMACMALVTLISINACNKGEYLNMEDELLSRTLDSPKISINEVESGFNRFVGAPIDGTIGLKWIKNYTGSHTGRMEYFVLLSELQKILKNSNSVGICLYYAVDEKGEKIVIPVGLDQTGSIIKQTELTTESGNVDWNTAQKWISNFKGSIKAHFFGSNTFERLMKDPYCSVIRASYATDDGGSAQLLLSNAAELDPLVYEDASRPCPPYCPINN